MIRLKVWFRLFQKLVGYRGNALTIHECFKRSAKGKFSANKLKIGKHVREGFPLEI